MKFFLLIRSDFYPEEPGSGAASQIGSRLIRYWFLIGIVIAIAVSKSGSDSEMRELPGDFPQAGIEIPAQ